MAHYTPAQTRWFLAAVEAQETEAHKASVMGARAAELAPKDFKAYLATLGPQGTSEGQNSENSR